MTDRIQPGALRSIGWPIEAGQAWGQFSDGWIIPGDEPSRSAQHETNIDETALNTFDATHSDTSLTVTIEAGEGFVDGWIVRDEPSDVQLDESTEEQRVYLGWDVSAIWTEASHGENRDAADTAIIGLEDDFDNLDPKVAIWEFDTDTNGVTDVRDVRDIGQTIYARNKSTRQLIDQPDRLPIAELDDGESIEIPVIVEDGETLEVYRWGAYDVSDASAPTGLDVELLDGSDTVQIADNTTDDSDPDSAVASYENTSAATEIFKLRAKNDTGSTIDDPGVGSHFGYRVI